MYITNFICSLDSRRPLVFLCGPAYSPNPQDRRWILSHYIQSKWSEKEKDKYVHAFPIVVDELFKPDEIKEKKLDIRLNILEEIVSKISYKTYIFLDTMSTSYEMGQFTNFAYNNDSVTIFVDKKYRGRKNNAIGEYIRLSIDKSFVEYTASYDNNGLIYFPEKDGKGKTRIPKEILKVLEDDNPVKKGCFLNKILFSTYINDLNKPGYIVYHRSKDLLSFNFCIRNLFYYISSVYKLLSKSSQALLNEIPQSPRDYRFKEFVKFFKQELLKTFVCVNNSSNISFLLTADFSIEVNVENLDCDELIYHMLYISYKLFNIKSSSSRYLIPEASDQSSFDSIYFVDGLEMFGLFDNETMCALDKNRYLPHKQCISFRTLKIKNKTRNILAYRNNFFGERLRGLHQTILDSFLSKLPTSKSSYAYKKGKNTLVCLKQHEGNYYFAKFDIHKYFESIRLKMLGNKIQNYFYKKINALLSNLSLSYSNKKRIYSKLTSILKPLFYKYQLPIGFVSSPKISDFYLFECDERMNKQKGIIYTRYADDILISSKSKGELDEGIRLLKSLLREEELVLNEKKTRFAVLNHENDSFKFLGINIVRRKGDLFDYTISNTYLVQTCKMFFKVFEEWEWKKDINEVIKVNGRISYIKNISNNSFKRFLHLLKVKFKDGTTISDLYWRLIWMDCPLYLELPKDIIMS